MPRVRVALLALSLAAAGRGRVGVDLIDFPSEPSDARLSVVSGATLLANGGRGGNGGNGGSGGNGGTGARAAESGTPDNATNGGGGGGGAVGRIRLRARASCAVGGTISPSASQSCP